MERKSAFSLFVVLISACFINLSISELGELHLELSEPSEISETNYENNKFSNITFQLISTGNFHANISNINIANLINLFSSRNSKIFDKNNEIYIFHRNNDYFISIGRRNEVIKEDLYQYRIQYRLSDAEFEIIKSQLSNFTISRFLLINLPTFENNKLEVASKTIRGNEIGAIVFLTENKDFMMDFPIFIHKNQWKLFLSGIKQNITVTVSGKWEYDGFVYKICHKDGKVIFSISTPSLNYIEKQFNYKNVISAIEALFEKILTPEKSCFSPETRFKDINIPIYLHTDHDLFKFDSKIPINMLNLWKILSWDNDTQIPNPIHISNGIRIKIDPENHNIVIGLCDRDNPTVLNKYPYRIQYILTADDVEKIKEEMLTKSLSHKLIVKLDNRNTSKLVLHSSLLNNRFSLRNNHQLIFQTEDSLFLVEYKNIQNYVRELVITTISIFSDNFRIVYNDNSTLSVINNIRRIYFSLNFQDTILQKGFYRNEITDLLFFLSSKLSRS